MGEFVNALRALQSKTQSPNGAVDVTISRINDITVEVNHARRRSMDEYQIAEEIEAAVAEAWSNQRAGIQELVAAQGIRKPSPTRRPPWAEEFGLEVETIETRGDSSKGYVSAYWGGGGEEIFVELKQNVVRRTDISVAQLNTEITEAVMNSRRAFVREFSKTLRKFQSSNQAN